VRRPQQICESFASLITKLFVLLCNVCEERVSAEECHNADEHKVAHGLEHVELQPEHQIQAEDCAKSKMES